MGKVIYIDEYLKMKQFRQRDLLAMIEGHLAEAGLLERGNCICGMHQHSEACKESEEFWLTWEAAESKIEEAEWQV